MKKFTKIHVNEGTSESLYACNNHLQYLNMARYIFELFQSLIHIIMFWHEFVECSLFFNIWTLSLFKASIHTQRDRKVLNQGHGDPKSIVSRIRVPYIT